MDKITKKMSYKIDNVINELMLIDDIHDDEQKIFFKKYIKNCLRYYIGEKYKDEIIKILADKIENDHNDDSLQQKIDEFVYSKIDELDDIEITIAIATGSIFIENAKNEFNNK